MNFYLAGSFGRADELRAAAERLRAAGHFVTSRWLFTDHEVDIEDLSYDGLANRFAMEDIEDILGSDAMIFFSSRDHPKKGRGGRQVEFGFALRCGIAIIIIGRRENAFHALITDERIFPTFHDFMESPLMKKEVTW